jgi:hypothetical protein
MEVAVAVMDGLGIEGRLWHIRLKDVAPLQPYGLSLGRGIQQGRELPRVPRDLHERVQLVPLHPCAQGLKAGIGLGPLGGLHECIACGDQVLELGQLVGAVPCATSWTCGVNHSARRTCAWRSRRTCGVVSAVM